MKQRVVIIGHSYISRLSLVRSVAAIGCDVTVIVMASSLDKGKSLKKPIDCYSKYVSRFFYCPRKDEDALVSLLLEKCTDPQQKVVLIPDGDDVVYSIDHSKDRLQPFFWFPHLLSESTRMAYWMDKYHQKALAKELGLDVADATVIEIQGGKYSIPADIRYPCFPKPLATLNGGKGGMQRCNNSDDLAKALDCMVATRNVDLKVLVEDYKMIDTEYALLGFSDGKEVIIPGVLQFLRLSRSHKGIALQGKVVPVTAFASLLDKFKQLVLRIGFIGVFDIDFYQSGDIFYFCELNLRYGGSGYAITKMGVNLPAMMIRRLFGESVPDEAKAITYSAVYVNDKMCFDDWCNGVISLRDYRKILNTAEIRFLPDTLDPLPEKVYNAAFRKRLVLNAIKKVIHKS